MRSARATCLVGVVVAWRMLLAGLSCGNADPAVGNEQVMALRRAHAHNDYEHPRPLLDALSRGFCSVEADVHLVDNQLLVGHDAEDLVPGRTLSSLYLEPLRQRIQQRGGWVYGPDQSVTLLIDIKTDGPATYRLLRKELAAYRELFADGEDRPAPLRAIVSGNRPRDEIAADQMRLVGVDGRLAELATQRSARLVPLVSDNWRNHFRWRGVGELPPVERQKLNDIVQAVHAQGQQIRFWATTDSPAMWAELWAAGVDLIGTDDLEGLRKFLADRSQL